MKSTCDNYREALVDLAEGRTSKEVEAHVAKCSSCAIRLEELRAILAASRIKVESAPADLIAAVKSLIGQPVRRATLRMTTLGLAGARSASQSFQAIYEIEGKSLRLMYEQTPQGWEVLGQFDGGASEIRRQATGFRTDESGRFQFTSGDLSDTGFSIEAFAVPSGQELIDGHS
jgi:hypothetical protein